MYTFRKKKYKEEDDDDEPRFKVVRGVCPVSEVPNRPTMMELLVALNTPVSKKVKGSTPSRKGTK